MTIDLHTHAKWLVQGLDQRMSPSLYDAAWLLRLSARDGSGRWAVSLDWLLGRQHSDGSWGAGIRYYHHDRTICTLITLIALAEQPQTARTAAAIRRGEKYLWQNAHLVFRDPAFTELVGFELIFPTLMAEARDLGLQIPGHNYGLGQLKNEKLKLIPPEMLYSRNLTTVHSLEFLGGGTDAAALHNAVFDNGSLGNSPATTAFYLRLCLEQGVEAQPSATAYLSRVCGRYAPASVLYPFRNFENLWVLNNFSVINGAFSAREWIPDRLLDELEADLSNGGVSLDAEFGIPDADCTSVAYSILALAGRPVEPAALMNYEVPGERIFRTYFFERNPSVSTNIHALEALRLLPAYPDRAEAIERIEAMLASSRRFNLFWTDKWHASPYYATSYAVIALLNGNGCMKDLCEASLAWLSHGQRDDGSWGFFNRGTAEETAYAMLALQHAHLHGLADKEILARGADYLLQHGQLDCEEPYYEELWLGKCLYAPHDIVRSAILAAMIQQEEMFGSL